ncbi:hypothetical protein P8C59_007662 [Phyllachora maydis]|uniref:Uncharacterized protein n=1 Tax=Phyllachora maydis TaxID=1825666 RepID=A0AAD9I9Y5_9PEZI|nr:hypothetical protein P8C59_007662 [Phyllachora maydis]
MYIACLPCRRYYYDSSFANLLIANTDSFSNLDNLVYTILASTPTKPAKITPAIRHTAACKAKRRKSAKTYAIAGRAAAANNAGRYTTDSGLAANKDNNNAYNRVYMPPADIEEEEGSSSDDNSVNSGASDSADKGKGSSIYKRGKGTLHCKDILLYKQ